MAHAQWVRLVHTANKRAARPVKADVIKSPEYAQAVLRVGMENHVTRPAAQAVSPAVTSSMETVCVNLDGKEMDVKVYS